MNQSTITTGFSQQAFDEFLQNRDEPGWLSDLRRAAWKTFNDLPIPSRKEEEWLRTDIRLFRLHRYGFPVPPATEEKLPSPLLTQGVELAGQLTLVNSREQSSRFDSRWADRGILFGSLQKLLQSHGDLLKPHLLSRAVDPHTDKFSALHAACFSGGTLLYVPRGVNLEQPLHVLSTMTDGGVDLSHTLVILEEGAEATLLVETASTTSDGSGLHCGATELLVGPGANLRFVNLQNWGTGVWHFAHQKALVESDAYLQWTTSALGSRLAKVNQHTSLVGRGASAQVNGVMFTEGKQHFSFHTLQHHEAAHCTSDLLYKGAQQDHSHMVWRGMIRVDKGAQQTNAYQRDDNLILSENARADSIPGLEIEADDVVCTHGATVGRVDEEQIFYARSRGYTRQEAISMIVAGFFQGVFDRIPIPSVREALAEAIGRRIREVE